MDIPTLIADCVNPAPSAIVSALIEVESSGVLYALKILSPEGTELSDQPEVVSVPEAITTAKIWTANGYIAKIGLMQVSSIKFEGLGISIEKAFSPCPNILAGSMVYNAAADHVATLGKYFQTPERKLLAAISEYKTGSPWKGIKSGYSAKVRRLIPSGSIKVTPSPLPMKMIKKTKPAPSPRRPVKKRRGPEVSNPPSIKTGGFSRNIVVDWDFPVAVW